MFKDDLEERKNLSSSRRHGKCVLLTSRFRDSEKFFVFLSINVESRLIGIRLMDQQQQKLLRFDFYPPKCGLEWIQPTGTKVRSGENNRDCISAKQITTSESF